MTYTIQIDNDVVEFGWPESHTDAAEWMEQDILDNDPFQKHSRAGARVDFAILRTIEVSK